jgi:hypothetical protein
MFFGFLRVQWPGARVLTVDENEPDKMLPSRRDIIMMQNASFYWNPANNYKTNKPKKDKTKTVRLLPLMGESNQSRGCPGGSWYLFFPRQKKIIQKDVWTSWICYLGGGLLFFCFCVFLFFVFS